MDIATPIGILVAVALIAGAIVLTGPLATFIDLPSALIVVGGTLAAALVSEKLPNVLGALSVVKNAFRVPPADAVHTIETILELSQVARRDGLLALERQTIEDPFLRKAVRKAVDGLPQEEIHASLVAELVAMRQRHQRGQKLFRFMGSSAPAMGMIGTVLGLVRMLQTMNTPSAIGPAMAVALLTTMYGAILAFLVFNPIAEKLERRTSDETANMQVVIAGMDSILKGHNALLIRESLEAHLSPRERTLDQDEARAA